MHVGICIVGYRNCGDVAACLHALAKSTFADFEITICENGGAEAYDALIDALPKKLPGCQAVNVIKAPGNLGYAGGVNVCMRASAGADAWWILNPDTLPEPTALEALVERLSRGDCNVVGGVLYGSDQQIQTLGGRWRPWLARAEAIGRGRPVFAPGDAVAQPFDYLSGASMLVGRSFVETVGPMREDYFLFCEEVEWCLRGRAKGMRIAVTPEARVLHHQGSTTGSALALRHRPRLQIYLDERNKLLLTRDCHAWRMPAAAPAALLLLLLRYGRHGALRLVGFALRGWWAGVTGKRGMPDAI
jgi:GT2 family glycosyltransferase